jgi:glycosyltransferase involved in cell wall biosynthesis
MGLRVGILAGDCHLHMGGAWTFSATLLEAVHAERWPHEFILLDGLLAGVLRKAQQELEERRAHPTLKEDGLARVVAAASAHVARKVAGRNGSNAAAGAETNEMPFSKAETAAFLERLARDERIDIAWLLLPWSDPLALPYIATVWDLEHRKQPYFPEVSTTGWAWAEREAAYSALLPPAAMVITGTETGKKELLHYYRLNPANIAVIPFPAPSGIVKEQPANEKEIKEKYGITGSFLLYPAQFWPHKNHVNLLRALSLLRSQHGLDFALVLSGSDKGNQGHVMQTAADLGLAGRVHILGFIPRADLNALYRSAMALVFPSFFGPDNFPPLEAFALGCPVMAANVPGASEQIGEAALLFDPCVPADMAAKIALLHRRPRLRAQLIRKGSDIAKRRTPRAYIAALCSHLDRFEAIRRCWGAAYEHP